VGSKHRGTLRADAHWAAAEASSGRRLIRFAVSRESLARVGVPHRHGRH
jgi:hypothetical protein